MKGLKLISENIRGLRTNVGELTHSFVLNHKLDIFATVETFLNESVPQSFGTHGLEDHVLFATYISDSLWDPIITDFQPSRVMYGATVSLGSSELVAVLSTILLEVTYDKGNSYPLWQ